MTKGTKHFVSHKVRALYLTEGWDLHTLLSTICTFCRSSGLTHERSGS